MTPNSISTDQALENLNIKTLNEMQHSAAEAYQSKKDIILLSPTGSGKTVGFLLPILTALRSDIPHIQALVLAPSRELALQIEDVFKKMKTGFKSSCCYGGHSVKTEINNLSEPPALLIGTPGRIDDLIKRGILNLKQVQIIVLDEFDKSLEFGFQEEMSYIIGKLSNLKQRFLISATELERIPDFVGMKAPVYLNFLNNAETPLKLEIKQVVSSERDKLKTLLKLIGKIGNQSILIFLNLRESVERVSQYLDDQGVVNGIYHGGLEQIDRERALTKFRNGSTQILVTTDLAARGLDIPEIRAVIHYHLPLKEDEFIHRNGRTARMHASGIAYILISDDETLPHYMSEDYPYETLPDKFILPQDPEWETLYIGKGKKDKINKVDIVGFLCQKGNLDKHDIGLIEVKDSFAHVAVRRKKIYDVIKKVRDEKLKNIKVKIEVAR